ncbi:MAG: DUF523 domain-containing protein [Candidatus Cloacimonetes bacterium]|nr:DUF523 domain-containing protein [Candidatus Cloacimonadota bacterium]
MAGRARKIILLSHCLLNVNSKVEGKNPYSSIQKELVKLLMDKDYAIIQLPCPEITHFGVRRWAHVRDQFDFPIFRRHCRKIFKPVLHQIEDYLHNGYDISGIIWVEGSPCCGLNLVTKGENWKGVQNEESYAKLLKETEKIKGKGIYVQEVEKLLEKHNVTLDFYALNEKQPELLLKELEAKL